MLKDKSLKKIKREAYRIDISEYDKEFKANKIYDFLIKTHPSLEDSEKGVVEIRTLNRDRLRYYQDVATGEVVEHYIKGTMNPLLIYKDNQSNRERVVAELIKMIDKPYCMYYSIYSFDFEKEIYDPKAKQYKTYKRIHKENSLYTECLICDFDHITAERMKEQEEILKEKGLENYIKIFSGHGYQLVFLLKDRCYDKGVLKAFTEALIENGLDVDSCIIDPARVMRLPYTHNNKSLNDNIFKPIETKIEKDTDHRYDVDEILKKLNSKYKVHRPAAVIKEEEKGELIPCVNPIENLLKEGPDANNINNQLFAICAYFKCVKGYSFIETLDVVEDWLNVIGWTVGNKEYKVQSAFDRATSFYGFWQSVMASKYGEISTIKTEKLILDDKILFNKNVKHSVIMAYIQLKVRELQTGIHEYSRAQLLNILNVSDRSLTDIVKELQRLNVLYIRRAKNKKEREIDMYVLDNFGVIKSYSSFSNLEIKSMFADLLPSEMIVYMLLRKAAQAKKGTEPLSFSLDSIAEKLGLTKSRCSQLVKLLDAKEFIKIEKKYLYMGITINQYTVY